MQIVAVLLMLSFALSNGLPDAIYLMEGGPAWMYDAVAIVWSLGYFFDPIIYIFTASEMRKIAIQKVGFDRSLVQFISICTHIHRAEYGVKRDI